MSLMQAEDFVGDKDLGKHRVIEIMDGGDKIVNKVHLERRDPYGLVHTWLDKGSFPTTSALNGTFTDFHQAIQAVQKYVQARNSVVSEIRQRETAPIKDVTKPNV